MRAFKSTIKKPLPELEDSFPKNEWFQSNFYDNPSKIKYLGKGNFGKIFHVISKKDNDHKALKVLSFNSKVDFEESKTEIEVTKELKHKNIIKIEDFHYYDKYKPDLCTALIF